MTLVLGSKKAECRPNFDSTALRFSFCSDDWSWFPSWSLGTRLMSQKSSSVEIHFTSTVKTFLSLVLRLQIDFIVVFPRFQDCNLRSVLESLDRVRQ